MPEAELSFRTSTETLREFADSRSMRAQKRCIVYFYRNVFSDTSSRKVCELGHMLKAIHAEQSCEWPN
ncbi:hypothetical protein [Bradyrhizobium sp. CCBAU 53380]|uniref:hypothetical protein n=1 Tax=Bradyrhizobium sp. CCBAU 53380 TaxID=1325117 RepID=UPI00230265F1|nr:hypothetical protein [Bradyrhizobium sp. CCBAU 53380]